MLCWKLYVAISTIIYIMVANDSGGDDSPAAS